MKEVAERGTLSSTLQQASVADRILRRASGAGRGRPGRQPPHPARSVANPRVRRLAAREPHCPTRRSKGACNAGQDDRDALRWRCRRSEGEGRRAASTTQEQISTKAHELRDEAGSRFASSSLSAQRTQARTFRQSGTCCSPESSSYAARARRTREGGRRDRRRADDLGEYLQSSHADKILAALESFARRRPWLTAGAGVLGGFVASRFVKASSDRRSRSSATTLADPRTTAGEASCRECVDGDCRRVGSPASLDCRSRQGSDASGDHARPPRDRARQA